MNTTNKQTMCACNLGTRFYTGTYYYSSLPIPQYKEEQQTTSVSRKKNGIYKIRIGKKIKDRIGKNSEKQRRKVDTGKKSQRNIDAEKTCTSCTVFIPPDWEPRVMAPVFEMNTDTVGAWILTPPNGITTEAISYGDDTPQDGELQELVDSYGPPQNHGQSITKVMGNHNSVTTDQGANGWTNTIPVNSMVDGLAVSEPDHPTHLDQGGRRRRRGWWTDAGDWVGATGNLIQAGIHHFRPAAGRAAAGAATLLANPEFEIGYGLSDRVDSTQAGNTIVQTQNAIPPICGYTPGSEIDPFPVTNDLPTCPGPSVERIQLIDQWDWEGSTPTQTHIFGNSATEMVSTDPATGYQFPNALFYYNSGTKTNPNWGPRDDVFMRVAVNHVYLRYDLEVILQVNPSEFHAGSLVLYAVPEGCTDWKFDTRIANVYVFPFQILNLRTTNTVRLILPYMASTPVIPVKYAANWEVKIMVLTPLVAPSNVAQTIGVTLQAVPRNVKFFGLRYGIGFQHWKTRNMPGDTAFGNIVAGQEIPLVQNPTQAPSCEWIPGEIKNWLELTHIPGWIMNVPWTRSIAQGALLYKFNIDPQSLRDLTPAGQSPPMIFHIMNLFTHWRGDMKLTLLFTGAKQHYGKLVVAFTPLSSQPPATMQQAMMGTYTVWDIGLNSTVVFDIPFMSHTEWKTFNFTDTTSLLSALGNVSIWVLNPLNGPASVSSTVQVPMFLSGASNFTVRLVQNPTFGLQAGDEQLDNLETGSISSETQLPPAFTAVDHLPPMETTLQAYFAQYRQISIQNTMGFMEMDVGGTLISMDLRNLVTQSPATNLMEGLMRYFTYVKTDLKIMINFLNQNDSGQQIDISYVPPGGEITTLDMATQMNNYTVRARIGRNTTEPLCFTVPYTCPLPVIPLIYSGYGTTIGGSPHSLPGATLGSLGMNIVTPAGAQENTLVYFQIFVAFEGFRAWAPRPPPALKGTNYRMATLQSGRKHRRDTTPVYVALQRGKWVLEKGTFTLSMEGSMRKKICLNEAHSIQRIAEAPLQSWEVLMAILKFGNTGPLFRNSLQMVSSVTDIPEQTLLLAQAQTEGKKPVEQGPGVFDSLNTIRNASVTVAGILDPARVKEMEEKFDDTRIAVNGAATAVNALADRISALLDVEGLMSRVIRLIVKSIGYMLLALSGLSGIGWAGLLALLASDMLPNFEPGKWTNPATLILNWIRGHLGITREEVYEDAPEWNDPMEGPSDQIGVNTINSIAMMAKNGEWVYTKVVQSLEWILSQLGYDLKEDPKGKFLDKQETIFKMYSDSIGALSAQNLKKDALVRNLAEAKTLLTESIAVGASVHTTMLTQIIKNYTSARNALTQGEFKTRVEPVVVYISGKSRCGKSKYASVLSQVIAEALVSDPTSVYAPSSVNMKHFDGYTGQVVHVIDDMGQSVDGTDWETFPTMVSTTPFFPPMASLEQKGTRYSSEVVIITSNFTEVNKSAVRHPDALATRLHYKMTAQTHDGNPFREAEWCEKTGEDLTGYWAYDCKMLQGEVFTLTCDNDSTVGHGTIVPRDLPDIVVKEVLRRRRTLAATDKLVPNRRLRGIQYQSGGFQPAVLDGEDEIDFESTIPLDCEQLIMANAPLDRTWFTSVTEWFYKWRSTIKTVATITGLVVMGVHLWKGAKTEEQGPYSSWTQRRKNTPRKPREEKVVQMEAPIYQIKPYSNVRSRETVELQNQMGIQYLKKVEGNLRAFGTEYGDVSALILKDNLLVTVRHAIKDCSTFTLDGEKYHVSEVEMYTDEELVFFRVPYGRNFTAGKNLVKFVGPVGLGYKAILPAMLNGVKSRMIASNTRLIGKVQTVSGNSASQSIAYDGPTFPGLCGAPVIVADPSGPMIAGIHFAGYAGYSGFAQQLTIEMVEKAEQSLPQYQGMRILTGEVVVPVHIPRTTKLKPSPAAGAYEQTVQPSVLSDHDTRLQVDASLDTTMFAKYTSDQEVPWRTLEPAMDLYLNNFQNQEIRTLTSSEAVNGTPLLEGMDMKQSPGYPYNVMGKTRREMFVTLEDGTYRPTLELEAEITKALVNPEDFFYTTHLKDELRPIDKIECGKTRVIEAASLPLIVAGRMLLGGLFEVMQSQPGKFGSAVGCDPDVHWTKFYWKFRKYSNVYDLDYSGYDGSIPSCAFQLLADKLGELIGDPRVKRYILAIGHSRHVYGREIWDMIGGMPSGCVGTSILNTILNNCFVISALMTHPEFDYSNFDMLAYGDDVIYAHEPSISPKFIKEFYDRETPLKVTPASKAGTFNEGSQLENVTFLKRHFVLDPDYPVYVHPVIQPEVYQQSIMWVRDGDWKDTVVSLSQLAFHSGPKTYATWCARVRAVARQRGVLIDFPAFGWLHYRWLVSLQEISGTGAE